jgi:hypothetical protein
LNTVTTTNLGTVTITNSGLLTIADAANMNLDGAFTQDGAGVVSTAGDITTTNDNIGFTTGVTLTGPVALSTGAGAGDITFASTVDGGQNLTLTAGTGNITFTGAVGSGVRLGILDINSATNVTANALTVASLNQDAGTGTTTLNGAVNTNTAAGVTLTTNAITVNSGVTTAAGGIVTLTNAGLLTIVAAGDMGLDGAFTQNGVGLVQTAGDITTTDDAISFATGVTLTGPVALSTGAGSGDITFSSTVDGGQNLTLTAGTGNITFTGAVGGMTRLGILDINSATNVTANALTVASLNQDAGTGATTLNGAVNTNTAAGVTLTTNAIVVNSTVTTTAGGIVTLTNAGLLTIVATGDMNLDGAFTQNGAGSVSTAGDITTTDDNIGFATAVTLIGNVVIDSGPTGGNIGFNSTVAMGANDLTLDGGTAGNITVAGSVAGTTVATVAGTGTLTVTDSGATTFNSAVNVATINLIDTTGAIQFVDNLTATTLTSSGGSNVLLDGATTTISNAVTFANTGGVRLGNGGDSLTFNGGLTSTASTTNTGGTITVNGGNLTLGAVTLNSATVLDLNGDGNNLTYGSINGASNLTITVDGGLNLNNTINIGAATLDVTVDANNNGAETLTVEAVITAANPVLFSGTGNNDNIIGPDVANTWSLTGTNIGSLTNAGFTANIDNFSGLRGGTAADTFIFNGGNITDTIDGDAGNNDTLNYANIAGPITITLTAQGAIDGYNGNATNITNGFLNMNAAVGSPNAADTVNGLNNDSTWTADNSTYQVTGSGNVFNFTAIEDLNGGSGSDNITILAAGHSGNIDTGAGNNTITFNGTLTGNVDSGAGVDTFVFNAGASNINLNSSAGDDVFTVNGGTVSGSLNSGDGDDSFTFTGGTVTGTLTGGTGINTYTFTAGSVTGAVTIAGNDIWEHADGISLGSSITGAADTSLRITNPSLGAITVGSTGLNLPTLTAFNGLLVIGGNMVDQTTTAPQFPQKNGNGNYLNGDTLIDVNTDVLRVDTAITSGGTITLIAQNIELNNNVTATNGNPVIMLALSTNDDSGNITSFSNPTPATISSQGAIFILTGNFIDSETNLVLRMDDPNDEIQILVGQGETTPQFSSVIGRSVDPSGDTNSFISGGTVNIGALGVINQRLSGLVQAKLAKQAVLAGNLIGLQQLAFIDVSLFEEDLALYGTIGQGIALTLEQCEEIEGCAPDVTEEELNQLIEGLQARITELERRLGDPEHASDHEQIEELLAGYRKELDNFQGYLKQLQEYYAAEEEAEDFGEEFEEDLGDEFGATTIEAQIRSLGRALEVAKQRVGWLEQLKANAEERARLSTATGIELTIEALDEIINATNREIQFIEARIKQLQDNYEAHQPGDGEPLFWAEAGDNLLASQVRYGPPPFNADDQVLTIQTSALGEAWY